MVTCSKCHICVDCFKANNKEFFDSHSSKEELATRYGVSFHAVHKWYTFLEGFPEPKLRLGTGNKTYFSNQEVDDWVASTNRPKKRGRPKL